MCRKIRCDGEFCKFLGLNKALHHASSVPVDFDLFHFVCSSATIYITPRLQQIEALFRSCLVPKKFCKIF